MGRLAVLLTLVLAGCGPVNSAPMGPGQFMVACVDSPGYCASRANQLCPAGFDVTSNVVNPADYGRMTMIIRCR